MHNTTPRRTLSALVLTVGFVAAFVAAAAPAEAGSEVKSGAISIKGHTDFCTPTGGNIYVMKGFTGTITVTSASGTVQYELRDATVSVKFVEGGSTFHGNNVGGWDVKGSGTGVIGFHE